jgi:photosystem II stability/assembly factor-like uncharacterized protein
MEFGAWPSGARWTGVAVAAAAIVVVAVGCKRIDSGSDGTSSTSDPPPGSFVDPNPGAPLPADAAWVSEPSGVDVTLGGVWTSADGSLAVAVGDGGTIVVSRDGGQTWSGAASGVTANLAAVWGSGPTDVYAVGAGSTLLHSNDGARTWSAENLGATATTDLLSVWGSGPANVFVGASSSTIYRSRSGGDTWRPLLTPALTPITGIWGTSSTDVFASAHAGLLYSTNGGDKITNAPVSLAEQNGIWATSLNDIFTVNQLGVVTHYDGTETLKKTELVPVVPLNGVWGTGGDDVYAVGDKGRVVHSADDGASWISQPSGTKEDLHAIHGANGIVLAVGTGGTILRRSADVRLEDAGADAPSDASADGGDGG